MPNKFSMNGNAADLRQVRIGGFEAIEQNGAIPEPASWAMMIAGFGMIGATMRRRRFESAIA